MLLRKDHMGFWFLYALLIAVGWIGGLMAAIPVFLIYTAIVINSRKYGDFLLGFIFMLVLSDNIPTEQFAGLAFTQTLKNLYIIILTATIFIDRSFFKRINPFVVKFLPFLIVGFIAMYTSPVFTTSIQKLLSYTLLFIAVPTYVEFCYYHHGAYFFRRMVNMCLFIVLISVAFKYIMPEIALSHGGRFRGIFGNPNGLGMFLIVTTILFTIVKSYYASLFHPQKSIFIYLLLFVVIYWTGSRTAMVSVLIFLAYYQVFKISQPLGFLAFFATLIYIQPLFDMVLQGISSAGLEESVRTDSLEQGSGRIIAWNFAWENAQDYFFLGRGFAFDEYLMRSNFDMLSKKGHEGGVHNTYIIMWLNTGLIGVLFFFRAFFLYFINASKLTTYAFPAMFAVMFSITFEPWLASSLNPFTSIFLTIIVVISSEKFIDATQNLEHLEEVSEKNMEQKMVTV